MSLINSQRLYAYQLRFYWSLKRVLQRIAFRTAAIVFGLRYKSKDATSRYRSLFKVFLDTWLQVVSVLGLAGFLQFIDPYLQSQYQKLGTGVLDDGDYITFFATVSGIGGVFIGLYYAGISAIGSTIYATVPNNVRDLLAQERSGNSYMRFLSGLTVLGLVFIALRLVGFPRIHLAVPIIALGAGIGVIAFMVLGRRAFDLFDPTKLSTHIFEQLQRWLEMVRVGGFHWMDRSFQIHAHRQARAILDTLETLTDITAKERHLSGKPFIELTQNLLVFLMGYEQTKGGIPTDSVWYEQRYQHHDWYRTEDSRVTVAHETGTSLQPDVTTNKEWVEDKVLPILNRCVVVNLAAGKYAEILGLLDYIDSYVKVLARIGEVRRAFDFVNTLFADVLEQIAQQSDDGRMMDEVLEKVAVVERIAIFPVSVVVGYREQLEAFGRYQIEKGVESIRWTTRDDIYRQSFPVYCLSQLEWISLRLRFEFEVEGHYVTPLWYRFDLVCRVAAERFADNTKLLVDKGTALFRDATSKAASQKHPWLVAAIVSREWEYWHKVESQMPMWEEKWDDLNEERKIEGLPCPTFEIDRLMTDSKNRQCQLLKLMSRLSNLELLRSRPEGFPDFAGQFLHTSGEAVFDALLNNNLELLHGVIKSFVFGCLLRFESLRPKTGNSDWRTQHELKIALAPLLDAMDVSGYARLLADYHGNEELWNEAKDAWDQYLEGEEKPSSVPLLFGAVAITESCFEIPHRGILRTSWNQKISRRLRDVPRDEVYSRESIGSHTEIDHKSPLVRIFAREPIGSLFDGIDVFIAFYLRKIDGVNEPDFGPIRPDLQECLEREEQQQSSDDGDVCPE